ncbi:terminase [Yersinia rochesterensis]|uniref:Terminase n=1 Tax=Yersinia rochesterensis TaxID=1604335 RepID=A0A8D4SRM0_9GAMM|nr:terminase [Yersinia rochesterensis]
MSKPVTRRRARGGGGLRTKPLSAGTTRPLKFLRAVFFLKIKLMGNKQLWQEHLNHWPTSMK